MYDFYILFTAFGKKKHPAENNCGVPENAYYTLSTKLKVAMP